MSFKNTFSNKNRQTQKFVFNLNIWKFELHVPRIVATKLSPPSQNPGSFPDFTYSLQSGKRTQSYRSISHHQRQHTSTKTKCKIYFVIFISIVLFSNLIQQKKAP